MQVFTKATTKFPQSDRPRSPNIALGLVVFVKLAIVLYKTVCRVYLKNSGELQLLSLGLISIIFVRQNMRFYKRNTVRFLSEDS